MKANIVVTGLVLGASVAAGCAENAKPPTSAQQAAEQAEKNSQKAQQEAQEARKEAREAQQKQDEAQQDLKQARADELQAEQRAQMASHQAGFAEQQTGAAAQRRGVAEAQAGAVGKGQPPAPAPAPAPKVVVVTAGLLFATNEADLAPAAKPKLDEVAAALRMKPEANDVIVKGFTDDTGDAAFNKGLSERRAQAVGDYLESKGVPKDRVVTKGLGEANPESPDKTVEGRAINRRVEIVIQPAAAKPAGK